MWKKWTMDASSWMDPEEKAEKMLKKIAARVAAMEVSSRYWGKLLRKRW